MTEPDEALLHAREHWATICDEDGFPEVAEAYRRGVNDESLATDALFYRAGAAASAERIKELEAELKDTEQDLHDYSVELGRLTSALNKGHRESVLIGQQMSAERIKELEEALIKTGASLAAAISLLEHGGRKAAASDKMFEIMLEDYRAALSEARALLKEPEND